MDVTNVQISKSLFDPATMVVTGEDDTRDDLYYVTMTEETYERLAVSTHGPTA